MRRYVAFYNGVVFEAESLEDATQFGHDYLMYELGFDSKEDLELISSFENIGDTGAYVIKFREVVNIPWIHKGGFFNALKKLFNTQRGAYWISNDPVGYKTFMQEGLANLGWDFAKILSNEKVRLDEQAMYACYQNGFIPSAREYFNVLKKLISRRERDGYFVVGKERVK